MVRVELDKVRNSMKYRTGFTLTELSVLIAVGAMLASVLVADLSQTRTKLLQQACAANLKQWGMAFGMYADEWNGSIFFEMGPGQSFSWDDITGVGNAGNTETNPYAVYLGGRDPSSTIRTARLCPFTAAKMSQVQINTGSFHNYSMPMYTIFKGGAWQNVTAANTPRYYDTLGNFYLNLKAPRNPATFLLLIDSSGHSLQCGGLKNIINGIPSGDNTPAIARHSGSVNCLFGDSHVELVSSNAIAQQDAISCPVGNPWFELN
jgi:prepilin-type processing-associated H-X9-DG protein